VLCSWQAMGIPTGLLASLVACKNGVKRAHLVDARIDGGLILELYSRDGVGTMISSDFYEVCPVIHLHSSQYQNRSGDMKSCRDPVYYPASQRWKSEVQGCQLLQYADFVFRA